MQSMLWLKEQAIKKTPLWNICRWMSPASSQVARYHDEKPVEDAVTWRGMGLIFKEACESPSSLPSIDFREKSSLSNR